MNAWPLIPLALLLDLLFGEPPVWAHPVCLMGAMARRAERFWRGRTGPGPASPDCRGERLAGGLFTAGALAWLAVCLPCAASAVALTLAANVLPLPGDGAAWATAAVLTCCCLAPRSLGEHAARVAGPLARLEHSRRRGEDDPQQQTGSDSDPAGDADLAEARSAVSMLVGRDTARLDAHGVARACIESVGENVTDGVLATLFWATAGALAAGPAGVAGAVVLHRAANVLDALWGKRDEAYSRFGTWSARMDDALNWLPARLALPAIAVAALLVPGCSAPGALRMGVRYRAAHASPNSAWSEAAFAGALGLRLGGPVSYRGRPAPYPWLGEGRPDAGSRDIERSIALMRVVTAVFGLGCCAALAVCGG